MMLVITYKDVMETKIHNLRNGSDTVIQLLQKNGSINPRFSTYVFVTAYPYLPNKYPIISLMPGFI